MAIAFDAFTLGNAVTTDDTFTHTPVGTPRAVLVYIAQRGSSSDVVVGVTYGGVAMTRVTNGFAQDTAGEVIAHYGYFLGTGIPTGAQTVAIDQGTAGIRGICITATAAADTEVEASGVQQGDQTSPAVVLSTGVGVECFVTAGFTSGFNNQGNSNVGADYTNIASNDFGAETARWEYRTSNSTGGNVTADFDTAASGSDDVAMVAIAIKESAGAGGDTLMPAILLFAPR